MEISVGEVCDATITGIKSFGAFVITENREIGMVHISQVSSDYVKDISQHLQIGDKVRVKLIKINEDGKLAFSIKETLSKPKIKQQKSIVWQPKPQKNNEDMSFEGMMSRFKMQSEEKISDYRKSGEVKKRSSNKKSKK